MWYKIIENFNSLRCLVLEISAFQYEACHGFRACDSVHKLFLWAVYHSNICLLNRWNRLTYFYIFVLKLCPGLIISFVKGYVGQNVEFVELSWKWHLVRFPPIVKKYVLRENTQINLLPCPEIAYIDVITCTIILYGSDDITAHTITQFCIHNPAIVW